MLRNIKMYLRFSGQNIHALMEYKNDFLVSTIAGAVWQTVGLVFLFALFSSIRSVGGWTLYEVALLYACVMFSEGVVTFGCQGASTGTAHKVRTGEYDRFMVRPLPIMTQLLGCQINFAGLCTAVTSIAVMIVSVYRLAVDPSAIQVICFILSLLIGVWTRLNIDVAASSLGFFTGGGSTLALVRSTQAFGRYPVSIFPKLIRYLLFSVLPHGMISYIPTCILLGKLPVWPYFLSVPAAAVFTTWIRRFIFGKLMKRYESTGN